MYSARSNIHTAGPESRDLQVISDVIVFQHSQFLSDNVFRGISKYISYSFPFQWYFLTIIIYFSHTRITKFTYTA